MRYEPDSILMSACSVICLTGSVPQILQLLHEGGVTDIPRDVDEQEHNSVGDEPGAVIPVAAKDRRLQGSMR